MKPGDITLSTGALDELVERIVDAARIPGAALAVVSHDGTVFAKGYGLRDLAARSRMTAATVYPIASTTKAFNATLLAMLVEEGRLAWDVPVRRYLPSFEIGHAAISAQVTLRDLVTMRTGLPRHDWLWLGNPMSRSELVGRLKSLDFSAGFRERFQYNNLTVTAAGHVAEVVTGRSWEDLVQERILNPLGMTSTTFSRPGGESTTQSYHETRARQLVPTHPLAQLVTAPSGGAMHSTVEDMARWIAFNLSGEPAGERALLQHKTLAEVHRPQITASGEVAAPTPNAAYAIGWFVDSCHGRLRLSHAGYASDVDSEVRLFPEDNLGVVAFTNFGGPNLARFINQSVYDSLMKLEPAETLEQKLAEYEHKVADNARRIAEVRQVTHTMPSHSLEQYAGVYLHGAYGRLEIHRRQGGLVLKRNRLTLSLEYWHNDVWRCAENDLFAIHRPHVFDGASRIAFESDVNGEIVALAIQLEPAVAPLRFSKEKAAESS